MRFISCRATYEHGIDDASSFAAAFAQIAPMLGLMPGRLLIENKHRAFTVPTFVQHVTREASELVAVYTGQSDGGEAYVYLRDRVDPKLPGLSESRAAWRPAAVRSTCDTLARTATTDAETKTILARWPEGVRQMEELLDDLEDLKVCSDRLPPGSGAATRIGGAPTWCRPAPIGCHPDRGRTHLVPGMLWDSYVFDDVAPMFP